MCRVEPWERAVGLHVLERAVGDLERRLLDVGHIVSRSMVNIQQDTGIAIDMAIGMAIGIGIGIGIATGSRVGMPARRRAVLTMAVLSMPLLTTYEPARRRASYRG